MNQEKRLPRGDVSELSPPQVEAGGEFERQPDGDVPVGCDFRGNDPGFGQFPRASLKHWPDGEILIEEEEEPNDNAPG